MIPRRLQFGLSITPDWSKQDVMLGLTRAADQIGLDLIGIQDHPHPVVEVIPDVRAAQVHPAKSLDATVK